MYLEWSFKTAHFNQTERPSVPIWYVHTYIHTYTVYLQDNAECVCIFTTSQVCFQTKHIVVQPHSPHLKRHRKNPQTAHGTPPYHNYVYTYVCTPATGCTQFTQCETWLGRFDPFRASRKILLFFN